MDFKKMISQGINNLIRGNRTESVIGVDIGTSSIKVVQLKAKGGVPILETYGTLSLGPYADQPVGSVTNLSVEKIVSALGDLMKESGVTTKESAVAIPSSASLVFLISLPGNIPEKQFADVVQTEARKYIPVPVSEVSLDFWPIPTRDETPYDFGNASGAPEPQGKTEVLIAAIHKDTLSKYNEIVSSASLSASFFEIEIFSSIRATFGHELTTVVLVDFGAQKTKITIVESGVTRSLHIVNRGSFDISNAISKSLGITFAEAEDLKRTHGLIPDPTHPALLGASMTSVDYIVSEIKTVISQYEKKHNRSVSKILLTGGGALLPGFVDNVQSRFVVPVMFGNPFSKVEAPAFLGPVLSSIGPEFAVALGLALRRLQAE